MLLFFGIFILVVRATFRRQLSDAAATVLFIGGGILAIVGVVRLADGELAEREARRVRECKAALAVARLPQDTIMIYAAFPSCIPGRAP